MKKLALEGIEERISDGQSHLEYLISVRNLLKAKSLDVGDVAFHKNENNVMEVCLIARILVPTFQMYKMGKIEVLATIKKANTVNDVKVSYKDLFKYDKATETLYK